MAPVQVHALKKKRGKPVGGPSGLGGWVVSVSHPHLRSPRVGRSRPLTGLRPA